MWQDIVLCITGIGFSLALIPTVIKKKYPSFTSSLLTSLLILMNLIVYFSLDLWFAFWSTISTFLIWVWICIANIKKN